MRQLGAAVTIVAAAHAGRRGGLAATAVCSVTTAPPTLLVSINRSASAYRLLVASGAFSVNILAAHQIHVARRFGTPAADPEERFEHGDWIAGRTGSPLLQDSVAALECEIIRTVDVGTHSLFLGAPLDIIVNGPCSMLGYLDGQFTSLERRGIRRTSRDNQNAAGALPAYVEGLD
jgi:flavin reductase (NADH)